MERFFRSTAPNPLNLRALLEARGHHQIHIAKLPTVVGISAFRHRIYRDAVYLEWVRIATD